MRVIILSCLVTVGLCCSSSGPGPDPGPGPGPQDPLSCFGDDITVAPSSTEAFEDAEGGPVSSAEDLNCDFEGDCCWVNEIPDADQLEFAVASGEIDPEAVEACFGTSTTPEGNFLVLGLSGPAADGDEGHYFSCAIDCTEGDITVTLSHWQTEGAVVEVCQQDATADVPELSNCVELPAESGGPDSVTLPACELCDIVLVAGNLQNEGINVVAFDDISVSYDSCSAGNGACALQCDFNDGETCQYDGTTGDVAWTTSDSLFGNKDTGVPNSADDLGTEGNERPENDGFLATIVQSGDALGAQLDSPDLGGLESDVELSYYFYEATDSCSILLCIDDSSECEVVSQNGVSIDDHNSWQQGSVIVPAGSSKVSFVCDNTGLYFCACGLDRLDVHEPGEEDSLCA